MPLAPFLLSSVPFFALLGGPPEQQDGMMPSRHARHLSVVAILAAVYVIAGKLGLMLAFVHASATAVWPPTGIALAAFLVFGYRVWPGVWIGAFLANITTAGTAATSLGIATGNTLEGLLGAYLVNRFAGGRNAFERPQDIFKFALLAAMLSTMVSATVGVTSLSLGGFADWADYGAIWLTWWLGDAAGALLVAPPLLLWVANPRLRWHRRQIVEVALLLLSLIAVSQVVFGGWLPFKIKNYPLDYLCVPLLVWTAFRFGQRETATAALVLAVFAIWGTLRGFGPFVGETQNESLLLLQAFMGITDLMALALAAVVEERRRAEEQFRLVVEAAPTGMVMVDHEGTILMVNALIERLFGHRQADLHGQPIEMLVPERFRGQHPGHRRRFSAAPSSRAMGMGRDLYGLRKDGSEFPVEIGLNPMKTPDGVLVMASIIDITERKRTEASRETLVRELQAALEHIKTLRGLLPICASCKKIRNDQGYWEHIEEYVQAHSQATFTHGLCQECLKTLYPKVWKEVQEKEKLEDEKGSA